MDAKKTLSLVPRRFSGSFLEVQAIDLETGSAGEAGQEVGGSQECSRRALRPCPFCMGQTVIPAISLSPDFSCTPVCLVHSSPWSVLSVGLMADSFLNPLGGLLNDSLVSWLLLLVSEKTPN